MLLECVIGELRAAAGDTEPPPGLKRNPTPHPDVLSANVHFVQSVSPGPFEATVVRALFRV